MELEMRKLLGEQRGKRAYHFNRQTLTGRRHGTEHQRQFAVDAMGVKDCHGVADHLSLKIMYLLPYNTQGRKNPAAFVRLAVIDMADTRLNDMSFSLALINGFRGRRKEEGGRSLDIIFRYPRNIVIDTLVKRIYDSHKLLRHLGVIASID